MDSVRLSNQGDCIEDLSAEQVHSPESPDAYDVFGESEELPRVGEQYQAVIPPLISVSDYLRVTGSLTDEETNAGGPHDFSIGLPISVMWISKEAEKIVYKRVQSFGDSNDLSSKPAKYKFSRKDRCFSETVENGMRSEESEKVAWPQHQENGTSQKHMGRGCFPVPGSVYNSWSDLEDSSFLLGLYIFGKNLVQVKRFIGTKQMGDILSQYYGKFYRSTRYRRWSDCRKMKSRRCIYGQKIFTGSRQQELLSRMLPHVSEECQNTLREVSKTFGEGKLSLEEYVSTLKATVGLNILIEAVGIGKEKQDLTGISTEQPKSNQVPARSDIPIGKACSTLTTVEIVNYLTGDFRLCKARSSDLFWEAVWPRLLARGWHSEQPKNYGCTAGSKHSLVFLVPGIKKFSRRKLVKGNHYFDSVSDVLSKVSSDPGLLELDIEEDKGYACKEESIPDLQRHSYLKPKTSAHARDEMKFTVVDTSLANGETSKVRQMRSLPFNVMNTSRSHSKEENEDSSEDSTDESDSTDTLSFNQHQNDASKRAKIVHDKGTEPQLSTEPMKVPKGQNTKMHMDMLPRVMKCQFSQKKKQGNKNQGNKNQTAPVTKRRPKLSACTETKRSKNNLSTGSRLKQEVAASFCSDNFDLSENILSRVDPSLEKLSCTSSSSSIPIISSKGILGIMSLASEHCQEKTQPHVLIDLNVPIPQEAEADGPLLTELTERLQDPTTEQPNELNAPKSSTSVASVEQQPNMNSRRQGTRNRPPTTKALEALACGFLNVKQKRKSRDDFSHEKPILRPSRRSRANVEVTENMGHIMDYKLEGRGNDVCNSTSNISSELLL